MMMIVVEGQNKPKWNYWVVTEAPGGVDSPPFITSTAAMKWDMVLGGRELSVGIRPQVVVRS